MKCSGFPVLFNRIFSDNIRFIVVVVYFLRINLDLVT